MFEQGKSAVAIILGSYFLANSGFVVAAASTVTPQRTAALVTPPPDSEVWSIGPFKPAHGQMNRWVTSDGTRWSRQRFNMRGREFDVEQQLHLDAEGGLQTLVVRGVDLGSSVSESFHASQGRYSFESANDSGTGTASSRSYYYPVTGTFDSIVALTEALLKSPEHTVHIVPSGTARLTQLTTTKVRHGTEFKTLTAYKIDGVSETETVVWLDGADFIATDTYYPCVRKDWEDDWPELDKAQIASLAKLEGALIATIAPKVQQPVLFRDVQIFDADGLAFRKHWSVLVDAEHIVSIGPAATVSAPTNALVISGSGKTLLPGLWDAHFHYTRNAYGPQALAQGITSVRDIGNIPEDLSLRMNLLEKGDLLGPRVVPLLLIDGPGPTTAQLGVKASSLEEGLAQVRRAHAMGYFGIKLYGSVDSKLISPLAAEAHRLGMRVQGHVPAGVRPLDAIREGYDEINHLNFVVMQAMPQEVVDKDNTLTRFYGPARYGGAVNWQSPELSAFLDELAARHTAVDTTISGYENIYICTPGKRVGGVAAWGTALPVWLERTSRTRKCEANPGATLEQMRAAFEKQIELICELHKRGVTILAGTDSTPINLVRDMELFHRAGLTIPEAIASATIAPARTVGMDGRSGSIANGKDADLLLVDGDPSTTLGDLRNVEMVMRGGRLMKGDDLRATAGFTGRPHYQE